MDARDLDMLGMNLAEVGTDCISRQAALDVIFSEPLYKPGLKKRGADVVVPVIYEKIKSLPSAQPEIIRCRECDWWAKQEDSLQGRCARYGMYPTGAWFCGSAERREVTT